jgi:hypothetical protein
MVCLLSVAALSKHTIKHSTVVNSVNNKPDPSTLRNPPIGPHYNLPQEYSTSGVLRIKPEKLPTIKRRIEVKKLLKLVQDVFSQTTHMIRCEGRNSHIVKPI